MEQTPTTSTPSTATTATASQPTEPPAPPPPQQQQQVTPSQPQQSAPQTLASTTPSTSAPNPNPNPNSTPKHSTSLTTSVTTASTRPPTLHRPWQHPHPHFQHFSSSPSPSTPPTPQQRGGVAIGVPAASTSFSGSFGQQFGGLGRGNVGVTDSSANAANSQVRQGMGMMGTVTSGSQMRPGGIAALHQQRPVQTSIRSPASSPAAQSPNTQVGIPRNFQGGHTFMRSPSIGSSGSSAPSATASTQSHNQPWMNAGSQPKPPLPSPVYRSITPPSMHPRSVVPQQLHSLSTTSQQQQVPTVQPQQSLPSHQSQEHYVQQFPPSKGSQSSPQTQQITRVQNMSSQKASSPAAVQPNMVPAIQNRTVNAENDESGNRILGKRTIHELVTQIDPSEKLDPEVEDILADIADDFIESVTTFGCSLAKHRKSDILEAKDLLLHLERNWNMTLPGFSGDEIKTYRKPVTNDIHKERLAVIKRSILVSENANSKSSLGQAGGNTKSNLTKTPANAMLPPNPKIREVT